jgi:hypothetical protein
MKMVTTGIVAAATLLSAAPALAIDVDIRDTAIMRSGPIFVIDPIIAIGPTAGR